MNPEGLRAGCWWMVTHPLTALVGVVAAIYYMIGFKLEAWRDKHRLTLK